MPLHLQGFSMASTQDFRARLERIGLNQSSFARMLIELGDPRSFSTVLRSIANYATGATAVPAEMIVILNLIERYRVRTPEQRKAGRPAKA
jgi:hypothetical protein